MAANSEDDLTKSLEKFEVELEGSIPDENVGHGAYGIVFEVTTKDGRKCIAKKLHNVLTQAYVPQERDYIIKKFLQECKIHSELKNANVVSFVGVHFGRDKNDISLIMERLHSDLANFVKKKPDTSLATRLSILYDVSEGLCYLHSLAPPLIHRDLTAPNILLTKDLTAKIGDLGVSRCVDPASLRTLALTTGPGNPCYMPPECRVQNPKYSVKLDIFSFGILIVHTINGSIPITYDLPTIQNIFSWLGGKVEVNRRRSAIRENMGTNHDLYPLVVECLRDRPDQRPSAKKVSSSLKELCQKQSKMSSFIDACKTGNVGLIQELLGCGADPNQTDEEYGATGLHWASNNGHDEVVRVLLAAKATVNTQTKSGESPLYAASFFGHHECVELLIKAGAVIDMQKETGFTPLIVAAQGGHLKIVELLIAANASVNIQSKNNHTALLQASKKGHDEVVRVLLAAKATVNTQHKWGQSPLWLASSYGHQKCAELLINTGAIIDMQKEDGSTALMVAAENNHLKIVESLIAAKVDVNIQQKDGWTALHLASQNGHCEVVKLLLEASADVNIQSINGNTACDLARTNGHSEICELLN